MRKLVITQNFGQVIVETSSGVRATGATVPSALKKLDVLGEAREADFNVLAGLFDRIKEIDVSQIGHGVASA